MVIEVFLTHYWIIYGIDEEDENLCSLAEWDQGKKDYYIYKRICELAVNSFVVASEKWFDVEIDVEQNEKLLKDITAKFLTKSLRSRLVERKDGHGYELSNLYRTIKVFKWIRLLFR